jgi:mycofactocin system creatininase family protein
VTERGEGADGHSTLVTEPTEEVSVTTLGDLTWPEAAARAEAGAVLAVPLGATEQHGPHLPLSTDADLAVELTRRLASVRTDVVVAPAIAYGSSGEHAGFAGTLSIGQDALELLLVELGRSAHDTFARVLFVSAHGGNAMPMTRAARRLREESRDVLVWMPRWPGDAHAGRPETAMQLAIDPGRVHMDRAEPGDTRPIAELMPLLRERGVAAVSPNGVLGDPAGASPEEGRALLDGLAEDLVRTVDAWLGQVVA